METITVSLLTAAGKEFIKALFNGPLKTIINELKDGSPEKFREDLEKYLINKTKSFSKIKTILNKNTPEDIYTRYFYQNAKDNDQEILISLKDISNICEVSKYITLIGEAGIGKSTLVKHLFLNCIKSNFGIPILVELRYLNDYTGDFESYIFKEFNYVAEIKLIENLLKNGRFVLFLDGFDELNSEIKNKVVGEFKYFLSKYPNNQFIITSRPYSNIERLNDFTNLYIQGLSMENNEIEEFIKLQISDKATELCKKIISTIKNSENQLIIQFLENPLLLCIFILTYNVDANIPISKAPFYQRVTTALLYEHDSLSKSGYIRQKLSGFTNDQLQIILSQFSYISFIEDKISWDKNYLQEKVSALPVVIEKNDFSIEKLIHDLTVGTSMWIEDEGHYSFVHRSLQEYYAVLYIKYSEAWEKEDFYTSLINKKNNIYMTDYQNIVDICYEIDTINYLKFYRIPIFEKLLSKINTNTQIELNLIKVFFPFAYFEYYSKSNLRRLGDNDFDIEIIVNLPDIGLSLPSHNTYSFELFKKIKEFIFKNRLNSSYFEIAKPIQISELIEENNLDSYYVEEDIKKYYLINFKNIDESLFYNSIYPSISTEVNNILNLLNDILIKSKLKIEIENKFKNTLPKIK